MYSWFEKIRWALTGYCVDDGECDCYCPDCKIAIRRSKNKTYNYRRRNGYKVREMRHCPFFIDDSRISHSSYCWLLCSKCYDFYREVSDIKERLICLSGGNDCGVGINDYNCADFKKFRGEKDV